MLNPTRQKVYIHTLKDPHTIHTLTQHTLTQEERYRLMCELSGAKRRAERLESKIRKIKVLVEKADKENSEELKVSKRIQCMSLRTYLN